MPEPALRPAAERGNDNGQTQKRENKAQNRRRVPNAIGNKEGEQGSGQAGQNRAQRDGGLHAPETALHIGELAAQLLRECHLEVIIILGHATNYITSNMPAPGGGVQIKTQGRKRRVR